MKVFKTHEWEDGEVLNLGSFTVKVDFCKHCGAEKRQSRDAKHPFINYYGPVRAFLATRRPPKCTHREPV
jgi:hypothetical protein